MSRPLNTPPKATVMRIVEEEATRFGVCPSAVSGLSREWNAVDARRIAISRSLIETRCSQAGLAKVLGVSTSTVWTSAHYDQEGPYAEGTITALRWKYGDARARAIVAGNDPATNADIAAWRAIGGPR